MICKHFDIDNLALIRICGAQSDAQKSALAKSKAESEARFVFVTNSRQWWMR